MTSEPPTPIAVQIIRAQIQISLHTSIDIQDLIYGKLKDGKAHHGMLREGKVHVLLDLSETEYVNVHAWLVFANTADKLRQYRGDLKLCGLSDHLMRLLRLSGMQNRLNIYDGEEAAISSFTP